MNPDDSLSGRGRGRAVSRKKKSVVGRERDSSCSSSDLSLESGTPSDSSNSSSSRSPSSSPPPPCEERDRKGRGHGVGIPGSLEKTPGSTKGRGRAKKKLSGSDVTTSTTSISSTNSTSESDPDLSLPLSDLQLESRRALPTTVGLTGGYDNSHALLLPPQKRKLGHFPGVSNSGNRPCQVLTNHFNMTVKVPEGVVYMYEVNITPPWTRKYRRSDKVLYQEAIRLWKEACPAVAGEKFCWVFDGHQILYSTKKHHHSDFNNIKLTVWCAEEEKHVEMMVSEVTLVMDIKITQDLLDWSCKGRSGGIPQDSIEALNVILKQAAVTDLGWTSIGRCFFPAEGKPIDLGFGKEAWTGLFSSVRPFGWKDHGMLLSLNVDTSNKPAVKALHLTESSYMAEVLPQKRYGPLDIKAGLTDRQIVALGKDLQQLKVRYEVPDKNGVRKRQYRVNDVRRLSANKEKIQVDGELINIVQYFKKQYGLNLKYPNLPCLWVGARDKTTYIPMEYCKLMAQPMPKKKRLPDDAIATMIRQTAIKPLDRQKKIMEGLQANNKIYKNDPYARQFGISLSGTMSKLTGRILNPPSIEYKQKDKNTKNIVEINKNNPGKWFMDKQHFVDGVSVKKWALLDMASLTDAQQTEVTAGFLSVGRENGINFSTGPALRKANMRDAVDSPDKIETYLEDLKQSFERTGAKLELIVIVFPFKAGLVYDKIKQLGDNQLNLTTQCCLKPNLYKKGDLNKQVIANICLKINSKLGGINHVLSKACRPKMLKRPVMIMGADVSHPAPETRGVKPSIAAIVASMEPRAVQYEVEVRVQDRGLDNNEEVINDMKNATKNLLMKFYRANSQRKPEKLVMFRDGVSEGQFLTVLAEELVAIRAACTELEEGYNPPITFVVVQKRHHTRFFPADNNKYKNGNALAGTVVDQGINHPTEGDFYLVSHEGIQGTSRPCHYQVLWDDSNMSADELETLAYYLCHLYSRCTRSVSYPTPTYYAHLVADRARKHHNDLAGADCGGSSTGSAGSVKLTEQERIKIQQVLEKGVEKAMYFV